MRLLIITQKIDKEDDVFGFFHGWLEKLAKKAQSIRAVCLEQGQHSLPSNLKVYSLGKEKSNSRLGQLFRFYKYIWAARKDYEIVFVHMNPIYVLLAGLFWKIWGKRLYLWYNHQHKDMANWLAFFLVDKLFYTSPFSFASRFKKAKRMPAGIDTELFQPRITNYELRITNPILFLGRLSPVKRIEVLIKAVNLLDKQGKDFILDIVGAPDKEDEIYFQKIKKMASPLEKKGKIKFLGKVANYKTPLIYNQHQLFVNLTSCGSLDKTILEAMACQCLALVSNKSFEQVLPNFLLFEENNSMDLAGKISHVLHMPTEVKERTAENLRQYVIGEHNLELLIDKLSNEFQA